MSSKRAFTDEFIWALEYRPEDFSAGECTVTDRRTGQVWWVANGLLGFGLYAPFKLNVGLLNQMRAWDALRRWQTHALRTVNDLRIAAASDA